MQTENFSFGYDNRVSSGKASKVVNEQRNALILDKNQAQDDIARTKMERDDVSTENSKLRFAHGEQISIPPNLDEPVIEIPAHRTKRRLSLFAEIIAYVASGALVYLQLSFFYLEGFEWFYILALTIALVAIFGVMIFYGLYMATDVESKSPQTIKSVKSLLLIAIAVVLVAFVASGLTRTSESADGLTGMVFNLTLIVGDISLLVVGSCAALLRLYFSGSHNLASRYKSLTATLNKHQARAESLRLALLEYGEPALVPPSISPGEDSKNVH